MSRPIGSQLASQNCHNDRRAGRPAGELSSEGALVVEWLGDLAWAVVHVL